MSLRTIIELNHDCEDELKNNPDIMKDIFSLINEPDVHVHYIRGVRVLYRYRHHTTHITLDIE